MQEDPPGTPPISSSSKTNTCVQEKTMLRIFAKRVTREGQRRLEKVLEKVSCSSTEDVPSPEEAELPSN